MKEIKQYLQESSDNGWTTKNRLQNIKKEITEIESEINSLENVLITYSIPESSYSPELNSIKSSLDYTNEVVDDIEDSVNTYDANNALTEINQALNELEDNKEKIIEIQNKAEKITNEDVDRIMNPIQLTHQSVLNSAEGNVQTNLEFLDYLFPSFLIFFILFDSIIFSASTRIRERKTNAYIRNIVSKTKARHFILGDFITSVMIISLQITGIILLASFFLNLSIMSNLNSIILLTIISVAVFSLIGITIGSIFKSQESVIISSISISLLFFIFSSLVTPLETLPGSIASIVKHTPLALLESKLRLTSIFNLPLEFSSSEISALIITILACLAIISFYYKKNKTKEI